MPGFGMRPLEKGPLDWIPQDHLQLHTGQVSLDALQREVGNHVGIPFVPDRSFAGPPAEIPSFVPLQPFVIRRMEEVDVAHPWGRVDARMFQPGAQKPGRCGLRSPDVQEIRKHYVSLFRMSLG